MSLDMKQLPCNSLDYIKPCLPKCFLSQNISDKQCYMVWYTQVYLKLHALWIWILSCIPVTLLSLDCGISANIHWKCKWLQCKRLDGTARFLFVILSPVNVGKVLFGVIHSIHWIQSDPGILKKFYIRSTVWKDMFCILCPLSHEGGECVCMCVW